MTITVQLFGPQATLAGERTIEVETATGDVSVAAVIEGLRTAVPQLAESLATSRLAINHEFADDSDIIQPGDEVALIGMVSGG